MQIHNYRSSTIDVKIRNDTNIKKYKRPHRRWSPLFTRDKTNIMLILFKVEDDRWIDRKTHTVDERMDLMIDG